MDLRTALPLLLPKGIAWAQKEALSAATSGRALTAEEITLARKVGVVNAELIRIQSCDSLPMPQDPSLRAAAVQTGLLGPGMVGLTLGYSVFVCRGHETRRLLAHEFMLSELEDHENRTALLAQTNKSWSNGTVVL